MRNSLRRLVVLVGMLMLMFKPQTSMAGAPYAYTQNPEEVSARKAGLRGSVVPYDLETTAWFEWGTSTSYGQRTDPTNLPAVSSFLSVAATATGLEPGRTYHYRVVATNNVGRYNGDDVALVTTYFAEVSNPAPALLWSAAAWGDCDNDGYLDLLVCGTTNALAANTAAVSRVYQNLAGNGFSELGLGLPNIQQGTAGWADFDGDSWLDFLLTGRGTNSLGAGGLYRNQGNGAFSLHSSPLPKPQDGASAWGDIDRDGDLDLVIAGEPGGYICEVFQNTSGNFAKVPLGLPGVQECAVAWGDYDNDGLPDLLIVGNTNTTTGTSVARLYHNEGNGSFSNIQMTLPQVRYAAAAWGDYDNDGWLDFILTGATNSSGGYVTRLYHNNRNGTFGEAPTGLPGISSGTVMWADMNNDGWLDVVVSGATMDRRVADIYMNTQGAFTNRIDTGLPGVVGGSLVAGDYDNDGRLDLFVAGSRGVAGLVGRIYQNLLPVTNTPPTAPTGLSAELTPDGRGVRLSWLAATDAQTPVSGLTYNVRVGTSPEGSQVVPAQADPATGWRRLPAMGNVQHRLSATFTNLTPWVRYYWSVQTVDTAYAGSPFAPESTFVLRPRILGLKPETGARWLLQCKGAPLASYRLEAAADLSPVPGPSQWLNLTNLTAGADGLFQFLDSPVGSPHSRYYRLVTP